MAAKIKRKVAEPEVDRYLARDLRGLQFPMTQAQWDSLTPETKSAALQALSKQKTAEGEDLSLTDYILPSDYAKSFSGADKLEVYIPPSQTSGEFVAPESGHTYAGSMWWIRRENRKRAAQGLRPLMPAEEYDRQNAKAAAEQAKQLKALSSSLLQDPPLKTVALGKEGEEGGLDPVDEEVVNEPVAESEQPPAITTAPTTFNPPMTVATADGNRIPLDPPSPLAPSPTGPPRPVAQVVPRAERTPQQTIQPAIGDPVSGVFVDVPETTTIEEPSPTEDEPASDEELKKIQEKLDEKDVFDQLQQALQPVEEEEPRAELIAAATGAPQRGALSARDPEALPEPTDDPDLLVELAEGPEDPPMVEAEAVDELPVAQPPTLPEEPPVDVSDIKLVDQEDLDDVSSRTEIPLNEVTAFYNNFFSRGTFGDDPIMRELQLKFLMEYLNARGGLPDTRAEKLEVGTAALNEYLRNFHDRIVDEAGRIRAGRGGEDE